MVNFALFLCLAFIACLLVRDSKRRASVSTAVWMPTFMLLILSSRPLSLWFSASPGTATEGNLIDQAFYLSLIVGAWIVASRRGVKWNSFFAANTAITLLYLYFAMSVFWAYDPVGSLKRWFKDFGTLMVISVILSEKDPLEAMRAVYFRCACVLFPLSVVFIKYYGDLGRTYGRAGEMMFTGVTTQKNSLGEIVMVFSLFLIWDSLEARDATPKKQWSWIPSWDRLLLLLMGLWLLIISDSKTAFMCLLIGLTLMLASKRLITRKISRVLLIGALSAPILLLLTQRFSSIMAPLIEALGRDMTFTGRTDIWRHLLTATSVNPLFGAGFYNFWGTEGGAEIRDVMLTPALRSAHNGYLDIYLDGGFIGLILLFCVLFARGSWLIANLDVNRYQRLRFAVLIIAIVYNLSESTFARLTPMWFTTLLVLIDFPPLKAGVASSQVRLPGGTEAFKQTRGLPQDASQ